MEGLMGSTSGARVLYMMKNALGEKCPLSFDKGGNRVREYP
jgi:acetyl-CoA carboxylase beta subunit